MLGNFPVGKGSSDKVCGKCAKSGIFVSKCDYEFLKKDNKSIDFSFHSLYYNSVRLCVHTEAAYQMENVTLALRALEVLLGKELTPEAMQKEWRKLSGKAAWRKCFPVFSRTAHTIRTASGLFWSRLQGTERYRDICFRGSEGQGLHGNGERAYGKPPVYGDIRGTDTEWQSPFRTEHSRNL